MSKSIFCEDDTMPCAVASVRCPFEFVVPRQHSETVRQQWAGLCAARRDAFTGLEKRLEYIRLLLLLIKGIKSSCEPYRAVGTAPFVWVSTFSTNEKQRVYQHTAIQFELGMQCVSAYIELIRAALAEENQARRQTHLRHAIGMVHLIQRRVIWDWPMIEPKLLPPELSEPGTNILGSYAAYLYFLSEMPAGFATSEDTNIAFSVYFHARALERRVMNYGWVFVAEDTEGWPQFMTHVRQYCIEAKTGWAHALIAQKERSKTTASAEYLTLLRFAKRGSPLSMQYTLDAKIRQAESMSILPVRVSDDPDWEAWEAQMKLRDVKGEVPAVLLEPTDVFWGMDAPESHSAWE